jgi:hypothetical protein
LQALHVVHAIVIRQLLDGIEYEKDITWYEIVEWVEVEARQSGR